MTVGVLRPAVSSLATPIVRVLILSDGYTGPEIVILVPVKVQKELAGIRFEP